MRTLINLVEVLIDIPFWKTQIIYYKVCVCIYTLYNPVIPTHNYYSNVHSNTIHNKKMEIIPIAINRRIINCETVK